jgi:enoyl-CoA hydratase
MAAIETTFREGIARIVVRNERRRNALSLSMLNDLDGAMSRVEKRRDVRVLLLEAEGSRTFSSGGDISEWSAYPPDLLGREWIRAGNRTFRRLTELDAVVICMLDGDALGGGLELALAADMRIASRDVRFAFPEVGVGIVPGWLGCARLHALIGPGRARQMILTGLPIDAEVAERWGLVNEAVPGERLRDRVDELAQAILSRSPVALSTAKRLLNLALDVDRFAPAYEFAASACRATPDSQEGVAAFAEKRTPNFGPPPPSAEP